MDTILRDLTNQVAPLLVQLLGAVVLAAVSALLLSGLRLVRAYTSEKQRSLLYEFATMAVNLAEREGAGLQGVEKAKLAEAYLDKLLASWGITAVNGAGIVESVAGAVETAWRNEIGPSARPEPAPTGAPPIQTPATQPAEAAVANPAVQPAPSA